MGHAEEVNHSLNEQVVFSWIVSALSLFHFGGGSMWVKFDSSWSKLMAASRMRRHKLIISKVIRI